MKSRIILLFAAPLLLAGCGGTSSSSSPSSEPSTSQSQSQSSSAKSESSASSESSKSQSSSQESSPAESSPEESSPAESSPEESSSEEMDDFSITADETPGASVSYDAEANVYTLAVCATKAEYVISGTKATHIVIKDVNELGDGNYKGVKLTLDGAGIITNDSAPAIEYTLGSKNVQISCKKGTSNLIRCMDSGMGILSANNVEVSGKGDLFITTAEEHCIKAEGRVALYGSNAITLTSGHDAIHCKNLATVNDDDDTEVFSGTVNVTSAGSQAFEGTSSKGKGTIDIQGGAWEVYNTESVFKSDVSVTIGEAATVTAGNITKDAVVLGDAATSLNVTVNGTFTVDGEPYASRVIEAEQAE